MQLRGPVWLHGEGKRPGQSEIDSDSVGALATAHEPGDCGGLLQVTSNGARDAWTRRHSLPTSRLDHS